MEKISYKFEVFEGPLDLLLMLVTKNKISIIDIKISDLLEQYLEYISVMQMNDMNLTSEFLEMASRLVYIKSLHLLPRHDDVEVLERELVGELINYQECKKMAGVLKNLLSFDSFVRERENINPDMTYRKRHDILELLSAYENAKGNVRKVQCVVTKENFSQIVSRKIASVSSKVVYILKRAVKEKVLEYRSLFDKQETKSDRIAVFLAVLELIKTKRLEVRNSDSDTVLSIRTESDRKESMVSKK